MSHIHLLIIVQTVSSRLPCLPNLPRKVFIRWHNIQRIQYQLMLLWTAYPLLFSIHLTPKRVRFKPFF